MDSKVLDSTAMKMWLRVGEIICYGVEKLASDDSE